MSFINNISEYDYIIAVIYTKTLKWRNFKYFGNVFMIMGIFLK